MSDKDIKFKAEKIMLERKYNDLFTQVSKKIHQYHNNNKITSRYIEYLSFFFSFSTDSCWRIIITCGKK